MLPKFGLPSHLAPRARVTPTQLTAVVTAGARDAVALPHGGAQAAGHHAAEVQHREEAAPPEVAGRLALHAGEAP